MKQRPRFDESFGNDRDTGNKGASEQDEEADNSDESGNYDVSRALSRLKYLGHGVYCLPACEADELEVPGYKAKPAMLTTLVSNRLVILPICARHNYWAVVAVGFDDTEHSLKEVCISASSVAGSIRAERVAAALINFYLPHETRFHQRILHVASTRSAKDDSNHSNTIAFATSLAFALGARLPSTINEPLWRHLAALIATDDPTAVILQPRDMIHELSAVDKLPKPREFTSGSTTSEEHCMEMSKTSAA